MTKGTFVIFLIVLTIITSDLDAITQKSGLCNRSFLDSMRWLDSNKRPLDYKNERNDNLFLKCTQAKLYIVNEYYTALKVAPVIM